jgi:uncharacterized protein (DUF305 family)
MKPTSNLQRTLTLIGVLGIILLHAAIHSSDGQPSTSGDWSELIASMDKMHMAMGAVKQSGDDDVDFVRLMIPHHQAAIDMAKAQLLYGKDPQMRRLAQEIITDQQSEIELMQQWLKAHQSVQPKGSERNATETGKDN